MNMPLAEPNPGYGQLLRRWRSTRGLSQLALAVEAGISPRHLSFLETGRSQPSRQMVELLAGMLDVPLEERNMLLLAAGYAPAYERRALSAPDLQPLNRAIDFILKQQEPYPAIVMDAAWNIVRRNDGARRIFSLFRDDPPDGRPINVMRTMFHPNGLRASVVNWEEHAVRMLYKVHRDAATGFNKEAVRLRDEILSYPGVAELWKTIDGAQPAPAFVVMRLARDVWSCSLFSTISTLGLPCDVNVESLRIECFFPVDRATEELARRLASPEASLLHA